MNSVIEIRGNNLSLHYWRVFIDAYSFTIKGLFCSKGLLPRGKMPNPLRERNAKVNTLVQEALSSLPRASFLSVDPGFVHSNGTISHQDMYDYLHLTPRGYQAVCEPLHAQLKSMLDEPSEN